MEAVIMLPFGEFKMEAEKVMHALDLAAAALDKKHPDLEKNAKWDSGRYTIAVATLAAGILVAEANTEK